MIENARFVARYLHKTRIFEYIIDLSRIYNMGVVAMNKFEVTKLGNPELFMENRMTAHSDHVCYKNWE